MAQARPGDREDIICTFPFVCISKPMREHQALFPPFLGPADKANLDLLCARVQYVIGAILSEPHTSVTSLHPCVCVCLLACLD